MVVDRRGSGHRCMWCSGARLVQLGAQLVHWIALVVGFVAKPPALNVVSQRASRNAAEQSSGGNVRAFRTRSDVERSPREPSATLATRRRTVRRRPENDNLSRSEAAAPAAGVCVPARPAMPSCVAALALAALPPTKKKDTALPLDLPSCTVR